MAEKGFLSWLFGDSEESNSEPENRSEETVTNTPPDSDNATLQAAITFITELQSYYYNDICRMQTDLLVKTDLTEWEVSFINKKIKQEQVALEQIDQILDRVLQKEREYKSVGKKSGYSFYDEIEKSKLAEIQSEVFEIMLKLFEINTKPELDSVIRNREDGHQGITFYSNVNSKT